MNSLLKFIWFSYFALAPVAWLPIPGLSWSMLYSIKLGLVGIGVVLVWGMAISKNQFRLPPGILGGMGLFLMLLAGMFGLFEAVDITSVVKRFKDIFLGFLMLWTMFMYGRRTDEVMTLFFWSALFISLLAGLSIMAKIFGFYDLRAPVKFNSMPISALGFGGKRGNWANGISLYVMPLIYFMAIKRRSFFVSLIVVVGCLAIIGSQFIVSGRTGLLASLFIILSTLLFVFKSRKLFFTILFVAIFGWFYMGGELLEITNDQLRLDNIKRAGANGLFIDKIDALSTGRLGQFIKVFGLIVDNPVFGYGFGREVFGMDVHNLWLRLAFECGILLPLIFILIVIKIIKTVNIDSLLKTTEKEGKDAYRVAQMTGKKKKILGYGILAGIIMTMLQPNVILGTFQVTAIWWAVAGLLLALHKERVGKDLGKKKYGDLNSNE